MRRQAALAIALLALVACQHSEDRSVNREIQRSELVGTWSITPDGIRDMKEIGHKTGLTPSDQVIELRVDGTCSFRGFLEPSEPEHPKPAVFGVGCRWRVSNFSKHPELWLGIESEPKNQTYFNIFEDQGHLVLWRHVADPDAWKYLELAKTSG